MYTRSTTTTVNISFDILSILKHFDQCRPTTLATLLTLRDYVCCEEARDDDDDDESDDEEEAAAAARGAEDLEGRVDEGAATRAQEYSPLL